MITWSLSSLLAWVGLGWVDILDIFWMAGWGFSMAFWIGWNLWLG